MEDEDGVRRAGLSSTPRFEGDRHARQRRTALEREALAVAVQFDELSWPGSSPTCHVPGIGVGVTRPSRP